MVRSTNIFLRTFDAPSGQLERKYKNESSVKRQNQETVVRLVKPIERPIERILVRYSRVPVDVANIVRLEASGEELDIREQIMHNAVSKYLSCR